MIIDLTKFLKTEQTYWRELEDFLDRLEREPFVRLKLSEVQRFHYLYRRVCADLTRLQASALAPEYLAWLEALTARAFGELLDSADRKMRFSPMRWFMVTFPLTFREHLGAFLIAAAVTLAGAIFGAVAIAIDPEAKDAIMPFRQLTEDPRERVLREETRTEDPVAGRKTAGSAFYMTHNTRVSLFLVALGVTYGIGPTLLLFFNGIILGAVACDYVRAGEYVFLLGWLMPHGSVEIPAILIAGQASLLLSWALIGWKTREPLRARLREIGPSVATLIAGAAIMLVWAGIVEAFFSQYHEPVVPYAAKIVFGVFELLLLFLYFWRAGSRSSRTGTVRSQLEVSREPI